MWNRTELTKSGNVGAANIQNGVTIATQDLKGISLSADKTSVTIGAGETWGAVYAELAKHGLTAPGGRTSRVGVTGLVLGGEYDVFCARCKG